MGKVQYFKQVVVFKVKTRKISFLVILAIYALAIVAAFFVFITTRGLHPIYSTFLADAAATILVWLAGILFKNSSIYDPYWSVAPIVIVIAWVAIINNPFNLVHLLFLVAIAIWGTRLTFNWAVRWKGLHHQDWRYTQLKERSRKLWFFTNMFGINLMPTIVVFLALMPAYYAFHHRGPVSNLTKLGFLLCLSAVFIQAVSDWQMDHFKAETGPSGQYIDRGLWKYSRHPNYFGEVSFWWGIWIMQAGTSSSLWFTIIGPLVMTMLFLFISIPLMEKHILDTRPGYADYRRQVSMIIPWPRSRESVEESQDL